MNRKRFTVGQCTFEVLTQRDAFLGLGRVWIGKTLIRSGALPLQPYTQTFSGLELARLTLLRVRGGRIELEARFRRLPVKVMRDHSFDPIHELGDWNTDMLAGTGRLDLVLAPARDSFNGVDFAGFAYHWEYRSADTPLYWILDRASWELGGDITGATAISQSACSAPVATFDRRNAWTTEGKLFFLVAQGDQNPVMTHNLPRWASHGAFDFQYKGDATLIGVFERVELIRSVICRDAGKPELKHFDKHIFDQALQVRTAAKRVLLHTEPRSAISRQNLWTWVSDAVDARARAEFGMKEEPTIPRIHLNFWDGFTVDSYYRDLLPAAIAMGVKQVFVDNLKKSCMTERAPLPGVFNWNMCCNHEYEISEKLGGVARVKAFVAACAQHGIQVMSWTNNDQALSSPLNQAERAQDDTSWYVTLEDTRQKWGGSYLGVMSVLDFSTPAAWAYFVNSHIRIHRQTGSHFFFDSFYNLGYMPVSYRHMQPRTMWRGAVRALQAMQRAGIHLLLESFGPWGQAMHGHPSSYNMDTIFACYKVGMGNDYTTVPGGQALQDINPRGPDGLYYQLAHKACTTVPLEVDGRRVDAAWGAPFRRALADYHAVLPHLACRTLQEDGRGVLWRNAAGTRHTLFNFAARTLPLPGRVMDVTAGRALPRAAAYRLEAHHTYVARAAAGPAPLCV